MFSIFSATISVLPAVKELKMFDTLQLNKQHLFKNNIFIKYKTN